ncbi:hypothetical protein [Cellvibrio sp. PSBB006]|uniref:hypothetical protein n=1 Tax=Cellvibrio sp. PSBB006 TaxID=1987723 RepID=UPI000B3B3C7D|nr:hypothetical protein [Cellvibrio sp. PSBB006]ARU29440.1 hypothetical protein CBR65_19465 [Cellvibrio sp. PSBB006]
MNIKRFNNFFENLDCSDPPHALMLNGVMAASEWIGRLSSEGLMDLKNSLIVQLRELSEKQKLEVIFVAQKTRSVQLLDVVSIIKNEGDSLHSEKVLMYANQTFMS